MAAVVDLVGIVGSGIMGAGIAETALEAGYEVVLLSRTLESGRSTLQEIKSSFAKKVDRGKKTAEIAEEQLGQLKLTIEISDLTNCDLVIETVVEDLEVKMLIMNDLDIVCKSSAILASNTSTFPVIELASATNRPDRVCGIHFFNPAPVMKLTEIVRTLVTSDEVIELAKSFALSCGKEPVVVTDQAGFVVNALLFPYLNNAIKLYERGAAAMADIDVAMKGGCGYPMGPFALLDLVGLDTALSIMNSLYHEYKDPNFAPATLLKRMVAAKKLGRKTGVGFYNYE